MIQKEALDVTWVGDLYFQWVGSSTYTQQFPAPTFQFTHVCVTEFGVTDSATPGLLTTSALLCLQCDDFPVIPPEVYCNGIRKNILGAIPICNIQVASTNNPGFIMRTCETPRKISGQITLNIIDPTPAAVQVTSTTHFGIKLSLYCENKYLLAQTGQERWLKSLSEDWMS